MDAQRALLDQLMGKERNVPLKQRTNRKRQFSDDDVCKYHLVGLCPYSLFSNTKSDLGEHPNGEEDSDDMKAEFKHLSEDERASYGYEKSLMRFLEELVAGCDRKVSRNRERCEQENPASSIDDRKVARLMEIEKDMASKTEESEEKAEEGELDESQELLEQVEALRAEKKEIECAVAQGRTTTKRNIVCEISGNIMSSADNEERIMCHFQGKQYLGWKACRERLAELQAKSREQHPPPSSSEKNGPDHNSNAERGSRRDRDKDHRSSSYYGRRGQDSSRERDRRRRSDSRDYSRRSGGSGRYGQRRSRSRSRDRRY